MTQHTKKIHSYSSEDIDFLEGLEPVRKLFSMYMGSRDKLAFQMVKEVVDNAVDEFQRGYSKGDVWVKLDTAANRVTIMDNGRGIPEDYHEKAGMPTMELLFTRLHSGGNFDPVEGQRTAGMHGVGAKGSNALSKHFYITSIRPDGHEYSMEFSEGKVVKGLTKAKRSSSYPEITDTGTVISFIPDETILQEFTQFNPVAIKENLIIRAYTNAGLRVHFQVDSEKEEIFCFEGGIKDYLENLVSSPFSKPYYFSETDDKGDFYEVAFQYVAGGDEKIYSYVNSIATSKGRHETGFKTGLTNALTSFMTEQNLFTKKVSKSDLDGSDLRAGLVVIINTKISKPEYTGQVKDELSNPYIMGLMAGITNRQVKELIATEPEDFKKIATRALKFAEGRLKADKYKEKVVTATGSLSLKIGSKYNPCISKDPEKCELFIVEGDSAGNTTSSALDKEFQAMFSLRGKPKNVNGASEAELISNEEISNLLLIIYGTNNLREINADNARFHSIFITSDADDDGAHIDSLCLQLFFIDPELFRRGYVKLAQPPKYRYDLTGRGKYVYLRDDAAKLEFERSKVKEVVQVADLDKLIEVKERYTSAFNMVTSSKSISPKLLKLILTPNTYETVDDILESLPGIELVDNKTRLQGIYDGIWHDITVESLLEEAMKVDEIYSTDYPLQVVKNLKKPDELTEMYPIDFFEWINSTFHFKYDYFKGLGEADAEELRETTFDPATRTELEVTIDADRIDYYQSRLDDFFADGKKNLLARRDFVLESFDKQGEVN